MQLASRPWEVIKNAAQSFYQWHSRATERCPVVRIDGAFYLWVSAGSLLLVTYTRRNLSASFVFELLHAVARVLRDFLGDLSECALQRNRHLVYEILTEVLDFGWPQTTHSEYLKTYVYDEPTAPEAAPVYREMDEALSWREQAVQWSVWAAGAADRFVQPALQRTPLPQVANRVAAVTGLDRVASRVAGEVARRITVVDVPQICAPAPQANRPIVTTQQERLRGGMCYRANRLFVDLHEELSAEFNQRGEATRTEVVGRAVLKNYIPGHPSVRMQLASNLYVRSTDPAARVPNAAGCAVLDKVAFSSAVHSTEWEAFRTIKLSPPEGESDVMRYYCSTGVCLPFRIFYFAEVAAPGVFDIVIKVRAELPEAARVPFLSLTCPMPAHVVKMGFSYGSAASPSAPDGQQAEYSRTRREVRWSLSKSSLRPGSEGMLRVRAGSSEKLTPEVLKRGIGPVTLNFEVQGWLPSRVAVQSVRVEGEHASCRPDQYLRYVCRAACYAQRVEGVRRVDHAEHTVSTPTDGPQVWGRK